MTSAAIDWQAKAREVADVELACWVANAELVSECFARIYLLGVRAGMEAATQIAATIKLEQRGHPQIDALTPSDAMRQIAGRIHASAPKESL